MTVAQRLQELGLTLPETAGESYYGATYGTMKPFHRSGNLVFLSGHVPDVGGEVIHPGALGREVTIEQGYEAARLTGLNVLAGLAQAVGDLDRVRALVRSLNFVVCTPDFHDVHKVSSGFSDLMAEVFGPEIGIGGRATIGVMALARNHCFETWVTAEVV